MDHLHPFFKHFTGEAPGPPPAEGGVSPSRTLPLWRFAPIWLRPPRQWTLWIMCMCYIFLGGSGRKTTTLVRDHEYFIPAKFHQNPSSGSGEEVENAKSLRTACYDNSSLESSAQVN